MEQTSSPLAFVLFTRLDSLIYKAWRQTHLPYDSLPSLCDYDRSAYLTEKSFPVLQLQRGRKTVHLGFRLVRAFGKQFPGV